MNYCISCGNELLENARFCAKCGTVVKDIEGSEVEVVAANVTEQATETSSVTSDEMKEKLSNTFSNAKETVQQSQYFNYFTGTLKSPASAIGLKSNSYGWIQFLVLALATTLAIYGTLRGTLEHSLNQIGMSSSYAMNTSIYTAIRNELIPRLFIGGLIIYLTFVASAFVVLKVTAKSKQSFHHLLTEFGGLLTPNVILLLIPALLTFFFASEMSILLSVILILFTFLLCFAAYNFYLYSRASIQGLDKMYVLLISNFLVLLVLFIIVYIQFEPILNLMEQIDYIMSDFRW